MRIISWYIIREFLKISTLCVGFFVAIYLVVDFFERIDDFLEAHLPFSVAVEYFLLKLPLIVQQGIPMGVLMGTLITLGLIGRNNELMALKASGVSPGSLVVPIILVALLLSMIDFALAEYVVPLTSSRCNYIWNTEVHHRSVPGGFTQEKLWYKSDQIVYNIRVLHPERQLLEGVTVYFFDDNFSLQRRLDARRAKWDGKSWIFSEGVMLNRDTSGGFSMKQFDQLPLELKERVEDFQHLEKAPEEMTIVELSRYVKEIKSEGYDATRYQVDFHAKIAFPITSVVMALLGIGVALYQGKRGGIAIGVAASVALAFVYMILFQFLLSLGYSGNLQPFLAAWTPNLFFAMVGTFLLASAMH
jgi:lipopolysaccharide export system permease protein